MRMTETRPMQKTNLKLKNIEDDDNDDDAAYDDEPAPEEEEEQPSEFLSVEEKRRILAQIARANVTEFMDDNGSFNAYQARRKLPGCAIQEFTIEETIRLDKQSNEEILRRKIKIKLVDRLKALHMDSALAGHRTVPTQKTDADFKEMEQRWRHGQRDLSNMSDHMTRLEAKLEEKEHELFLLRTSPTAA
jgi:hypothetical protein